MARLPTQARALEDALLKALALGKVVNEDGDPVTDFAMRHRDGADFASVSRLTLMEMLRSAYYAGKADAAARRPRR